MSISHFDKRDVRKTFLSKNLNIIPNTSFRVPSRGRPVMPRHSLRIIHKLRKSQHSQVEVFVGFDHRVGPELFEFLIFG